MSSICITHSAALRNYAPCSVTRCIALHVNSIQLIRVPHEYTFNWQQICPVYFCLFVISLRMLLEFFLPSLLTLSYLMTNTKTADPWAVSPNLEEKIKGRGDQGEICGSCIAVPSAHGLLWAGATHLLKEIKGVPRLALHTSNTINNAFSWPTSRAPVQ